MKKIMTLIGIAPWAFIAIVSLAGLIHSIVSCRYYGIAASAVGFVFGAAGVIALYNEYLYENERE